MIVDTVETRVVRTAEAHPGQTVRLLSLRTGIGPTLLRDVLARLVMSGQLAVDGGRYWIPAELTDDS